MVTAWRGVPRVPLSLQSRRSLGFYATHLGYLLEDPDRLLQDWRDLVDYAETHEIRPVVGATLPAARIAEAHRLMESRESYGKIVLMM
jgi:NADPH:quinone reductase-like Zn-dependent oxidoreductase